MVHTSLKRAGMLFALVLGSAAFDSLGESDLQCEEVAVQIADCCPNLEPTSFDCDYEGCGTPSFTATELDCLDGLSCEEVAARNLCERLAPSVTSDEGYDDLCR